METTWTIKVEVQVKIKFFKEDLLQTSQASPAHHKMSHQS